MRTAAAAVLIGFILLSVIGVSLEALSNPIGSESRMAVEGWVYVPAVAGKEGELVNLSIVLYWPGNGSVRVESEGVVAGSTVYSISTAVWTSALLSGIDPSTIDAIVHIHTGGSISGPSASLATAALVLSLLSPFSVPSKGRNLVITGAIVPQGFAGPVGGVDIKCKVAIKNNLSFILPTANWEELGSSCKNSPLVENVSDVFQAAFIMGTPMISNTSVPIEYPLSMHRAFTEAMWRMLNKTIDVLRSINKTMSDKNYEYILPSIRAYIENSRLLLAQAGKLVERAPYSAASYAFTALADSLTAYYALLINEGVLNTTLKLDEIESRLSNLEKILKENENNVTCMEKLEVLSVAAARLSDSLYNINVFKSIKKSESASPIDLGHALGMAEARIYSIESWLRSYELVECKTPLPRNLDASLRLIAYFVEINANYTISVLREMNLNTTASLVENLLLKARSALDKGDPILALGYYREVLSQTTRAIFTNIILTRQSPSVLASYYLSGLRLYNHTTLLLSTHGIHSLLAPAYLEYARELAFNGDLNSSISILTTAVAANEILLPLVLHSPFQNRTIPPQISAETVSSKGNYPLIRVGLVIAAAAVLGFSVGFALAIRSLVGRAFS